MRRLLKDRGGGTTLEYALLAAAIALVLVEVMQVPMHALGEIITNLFQSAGGHSPTG
jgi:Flp pilus assembly pilin Flp